MTRCRHRILGWSAAVAAAGFCAPSEGGQPSFRTDVMAAISKAGCNLGTCHGNATGKGGFKLSLRGQDAEWDYGALTREAGGRRINLFAPESSLILEKGANKLAHEGGKRLDPKGWEFAVLRDWIAAGASRGSDGDVHLTRIEATPAEAVVDESRSEVQIRVHAFFSDGSQRDVTQQAVYEPLQVGLATVSKSGLVKREKFGEPSILVRFLDRSQPVRLLFVAANPQFHWQHPPEDNYIDRQVFAKLKTLRINPSPVCADEVFVRRAYLDLLGVIPPADEARAFVADASADKRLRLVDQLLARPEFADFWAMKWADVLKVESRTLDETGMRKFHAWIRDAIARNRPLDEFVRDLIAARGSTYHEPAANFYRANRTPEDRAEAAAQVFLGTRLRCAQCHNHPFDRWTQDDYYNWAAVFGRIDYKILENKRGDKSDKHEFKGEQVVFLKADAGVENPRIGEPARARFLGADLEPRGAKRDELQAAAEWLANAANPLFARAQANRIWYHLMGRGLVDPVDDFRLTNPASHPKLLDQLSDDLVRSGFDLRHLIRAIMLSRAYQLDSAPNETNAEDTANYSRNPTRRISAEQMVDSLHLALGVVADFARESRGMRASQIPGPRNGKSGRDVSLSTASPEVFLAQFGRPKRELSCECERGNDTSMSQAFQFISGPMVHKLISDGDNRLSEFLRRKTSPEQIIAELYWAILSRPPAGDETRQMAAYLSGARDRRVALEDIAWGLVNSKEFVLRR